MARTALDGRETHMWRLVYQNLSQHSVQTLTEAQFVAFFHDSKIRVDMFSKCCRISTQLTKKVSTQHSNPRRLSWHQERLNNFIPTMLEKQAGRVGHVKGPGSGRRRLRSSDTCTTVQTLQTSLSSVASESTTKLTLAVKFAKRPVARPALPPDHPHASQ